jgi:methylenetetrahydrofolate dehydrogenase (NADP+) / methenyltetrahydrofolate cyclohydrolase
MTTHILDGLKASQHIKLQLKQDILRILPLKKRPPGLAVILVGNNPASEIYVRRKHQACEEVGIRSLAYSFSEEVTNEKLSELIQTLNLDPTIDGILVQTPLPAHIDENLIVELISPQKDVDGFHPYNLGRLAQRRPALRPCTPFGVMKLLEFYQISTKGLYCVVVGASNIVGRPMSLELLLAGATVTTCHRFTQNLEHHVRQAELLVVAVGKKHIVKSDWIKPGCIVIDVGMHRLADGKVCGDLDFNEVKTKAQFITPVPGGVGPMTVTMLLWNTIQSWQSATES